MAVPPPLVPAEMGVYSIASGFLAGLIDDPLNDAPLKRAVAWSLKTKVFASKLRDHIQIIGKAEVMVRSVLSWYAVDLGISLLLLLGLVDGPGIKFFYRSFFNEKLFGI